MEQIRLLRWISQQGLGTRNQAESLILEGRVKINGVVVEDAGAKVDPAKDKVSIDGKVIKFKSAPLVYWLLNKPQIVAVPERAPKRVLVRDGMEVPRPTIYDLPRLRKIKFSLSPVLPMDANSEGLLLLSNDDSLVTKMRDLEDRVVREYFVLLGGKLTKEQMGDIRAGTVSDRGVGRLKIKIEHIHGTNMGATRGNWYRIYVPDIRTASVYKFFNNLKVKVVKLVARSIGEITLSDTLSVGEYRPLTTKEIRYLRDLAGI